MIDIKKYEEGYKNINGINIFYKIIGKGIPIVVIHGGPGLAHNYLFTYFSKLSDDYRIIFYDQRACGLSSGEASPSEITMDNFVEDLECIRQAFNLNGLNLIGQSYGGLISLSYAVKYPQNMDSLLILESAAANPDSDIQFDKTIDERLLESDKKQLIIFENELETSNNKAEIMKRYFHLLFKSYFYNMDYIKELSFEYLTNKMVDKIFLSGKNLQADPDLIKYLSKIECPTLIIHGDYDPIPVDDIRLIHRAINKSQFVIIKDCGHFAHIEKPEQYFNEIRTFYKKVLD